MKLTDADPIFWDPKKKVGDNTRPSELMPIRWDQIEGSDFLLITDTAKGRTQVVSMEDVKKWLMSEIEKEISEKRIK